MRAPLDLVPRATGQQDRQIVRRMNAAVAQSAAIKNHGMIQQRAITVRRRSQFLQVMREQCGMKNVDLGDLCDLHGIVLMVRRRVVRVVDADLAVGPIALLAAQHERDNPCHVALQCGRHQIKQNLGMLIIRGGYPGRPIQYRQFPRGLLLCPGDPPFDVANGIEIFGEPGAVVWAKRLHDASAGLGHPVENAAVLRIAGRSDPPLPLSRLRGRGELAELRATDLRFTPDEAAAFLNDVMGLGLSTDDVAALETRTEGWVAGLQLAALSMHGREDVPGFIRTFAGDDRYIVDYLAKEVLQRQPERVRSFLLQTSILDRLSGPLCDAVTGHEDGKGMLEALERGNLFVVALDDKRVWYRYHHLFADVLQAYSMEEQPDRIPALHQRASEWYEQNALRADAIRHALAGEDFDRAAGLVELAAKAMLGTTQEPTLLEWLKALPDELVRARPVLSVYYAFASLSGVGLEAAEARLRDAERWLDATAETSEPPETRSAEMVVVDEEGYRSPIGNDIRRPCLSCRGSRRCFRHREIRSAGTRPLA